MAHTHTCLLVHIIYSTKYRRALLTPEIRSELFPYIGGVIAGQDHTPIIANGVEDHVHILCRLRAAEALSNLVRDIKCNSSTWIKERFGVRDFDWQDGYGAFSVSPQNRHQVSNYIMNQEQHHRARTYKEEYLSIIEAAEIEYDPRYLWD
jgi:putative transposase